MPAWAPDRALVSDSRHSEIPESGQAEADRQGGHPAQGVWQQRQRQGEHRAECECQRGPPREHRRPEECDAEQQPTEQVGPPEDLAAGVEEPDIADDVTAGGDGDDVVDELGCVVGQRRQHERLHPGAGDQKQETGSEQQVPDKAEQPGRADLA